MSEYVTDFEIVWKAYPRKVGKGAARKAWAKLAPDTPLVQKMLDAIDWQRRQPNWLQDGGRFVPHLSTWINQERWEDEPFETPQVSGKTARTISAIYGTH